MRALDHHLRTAGIYHRHSKINTILNYRILYVSRAGATIFNARQYGGKLERQISKTGGPINILLGAPPNKDEFFCSCALLGWLLIARELP